jgi:hypothetical protein
LLLYKPNADIITSTAKSNFRKKNKCFLSYITAIACPESLTASTHSNELADL